MIRLSTALCLTLVPALALQGGGPSGTPGPKKGECYENSNGSRTIKITQARGTVHGDMDVEFTSVPDGATGSTKLGTPDPDGGIADTPPVGVGGDDFQVKDSTMNWKNPDTDKNAPMHEVKCPDEDDEVEQSNSGGGGAPFGGGNFTVRGRRGTWFEPFPVTNAAGERTHDRTPR